MRNASAVWKMYRTRFLVKARQLSARMVFVDALGREQRGQAGDYLVEASDGSRSIQRRQIFEDIYVAMKRAENSVSQMKISGEGGAPRSELAAKRSQTKAHGPSAALRVNSSRGTETRNERAPEERKNIRDGANESPTSRRRSMSDHKGRASNRSAASA